MEKTNRKECLEALSVITKETNSTDLVARFKKKEVW